MKMILGPDFPNTPPKGTACTAVHVSWPAASNSVVTTWQHILESTDVKPYGDECAHVHKVPLGSLLNKDDACIWQAHMPSAGYFITKIFHPNVSKTGEICVNVLKRDWKADLGLRHVLVIIRSGILQTRHLADVTSASCFRPHNVPNIP